MVFTGTLDNADGVSIRKEKGRAWYAFNIWKHDLVYDVSEMEIAFSRNLLNEAQAVGMVGHKKCTVRVTIEVL